MHVSMYVCMYKHIHQGTHTYDISHISYISMFKVYIMYVYKCIHIYVYIYIFMEVKTVELTKFPVRTTV